MGVGGGRQEGAQDSGVGPQGKAADKARGPWGTPHQYRGETKQTEDHLWASEVNRLDSGVSQCQLWFQTLYFLSLGQDIASGLFLTIEAIGRCVPPPLVPPP